MAYFAFREGNQFAVMKIRDLLLEELVRLDLGSRRPEDQELLTARFLDYLREEKPYEICQRTIGRLAASYAGAGIRSQIIDMVPARPETEFQQTRQMNRHFVLHIGPTNCGKTYQAVSYTQLGRQRNRKAVLLLAEPARRRVAVGTEYQEAAGMPAPQPASRYISQPASRIVLPPVSYTHLDVYKRQILYVSFPDLPFLSS